MIYAAHLLHMAAHWIAVGAVVLRSELGPTRVTHMRSRQTYTSPAMVIARGDIPENYHRTLRPLYRLNFSSQVITGISSHKAWAMI
jgi:hypothetical protein